MYLYQLAIVEIDKIVTLRYAQMMKLPTLTFHPILWIPTEIALHLLLIILLNILVVLVVCRHFFCDICEIFRNHRNHRHLKLTGLLTGNQKPVRKSKNTNRPGCYWPIPCEENRPFSQASNKLSTAFHRRTHRCQSKNPPQIV